MMKILTHHTASRAAMAQALSQPSILTGGFKSVVIAGPMIPAALRALQRARTQTLAEISDELRHRRYLGAPLQAALREIEDNLHRLGA